MWQRQVASGGRQRQSGGGGSHCQLACDGVHAPGCWEKRGTGTAAGLGRAAERGRALGAAGAGWAAATGRIV